MTFSSRVPADVAPNRLSVEIARLRQTSRPFIDLTESNPTRSGFVYPPDLFAPLADARALTYAPEPLGLLDARRAVAADFARRGRAVAPGDIALTASTSEAYSLIFKILCEPRDEVLVPRPSYPLFEHLTQLDTAVAVPYDLEYHGSWTIDFESLEDAFSTRTRAVLVVTPNNPTGSFLTKLELDKLSDLCKARDVAVVADEVFADYAFAESGAESGHLTGKQDVLGFTLGGFSKTIGLPQAKLGWIAVSGPDDRKDAARRRLELVCDTYLSVGTPIQIAAAELFERGASIRSQIQERIRTNLTTLRNCASGVASCDLLRADGGWSAVLRVPALSSEEDLVIALLTEDEVLTHPGYFFDFPTEAFLVLSLLPPESQFSEGISRILSRVGGSEGS